MSLPEVSGVSAGRGPQHAPASLLALGAGALLLLSLVIPHFEPPISGTKYWRLVPIAAICFGLVAAFRKERGPIAVLSGVVATLAALFLVLTGLFPVAYSLAMDFFMPD